jgi:O-antigen ligase
MLLTILIRMRSSQRRLAAAMNLAFVSLVVLAAVWIGVDVVWKRFQLVLAEESSLQDGRMMIYRDTLRMIAANPTGVGLNGYQDAFRQYQTLKPDVLFDHAHNDYLETAAEWGFVPAVIFWSFIGVVLVKAIRGFLEFDSPERQGILLTCIGAIFSILVHSLVDFNLQIPSNAILFCTFVGIAFAVSSTATRRLVSSRR